MDISVFLTQQIQAGGKTSALSGPMQTGGTGLFSALPSGANFMDLIFAQLKDSQDSQTPDQSNEEGTAALTAWLRTIPDEAALAKTLSIPGKVSGTDGGTENGSDTQNPDAVELSALPDTLLAFFEKMGVSLPTESMTTETDGKRPTNDDILTEKSVFNFIYSALNGFPKETLQGRDIFPPGFLRSILAQAEESGTDTALTVDSLSTEDASPVLIATGKSPEDFAAFFEKLKESAEDGESYLVGLIQILPPKVQETKKEIAFAADAMALPQPSLLPPQKTSGINAAASLTAATEAAQQQGNNNSADAAAKNLEISSKLNKLLMSAGEANGSENTDAEEGEPPLRSFDQILKVLERAQQDTTTPRNNALAAPANKATPNAQAAHGAGLSTIPATGTSSSDIEALLMNGAWEEIYPDGLPWSKSLSGLTGQSLSLTGTTMLTSLATHAPQAGAPHPATQMVAAHLQKAAGNGESTSLTLELDPPDLGRVRVHMEFGKDKIMKAHLLVEKQETFLMLQRDAQLLERSLQDSGLDAGGENLSFELAQDGNLFGHEGDREGNGDHYRSGSAGTADNEEIEIIETKMDWYIDPDNGLMRYDTFV